MGHKEYLELSEKTLSEIFNVPENENFGHLLHGAIGIVGECVELMENYDMSTGYMVGKKNGQGSLEEELGDVAWFCAIYHRWFGKSAFVECSASINDSEWVLLLQMVRSATELLDTLKKTLFYGKPMDRSLVEQKYMAFEQNFIDYSALCGVDLVHSMEKNISKLKARYGEKFSSDKAINRDLDTEKQILQ